ncbi:MAG: alkaline phosphatase [Planctomycetia bacterium]|nr:alkaline phosphatase [Planctomycetia bacterium]
MKSIVFRQRFVMGALLIFFIIASCSFGQNAKNVILMIGDGFGFNTDIAGTYWRYGQANAQTYHKFPKHLGVMTFSISKEDYSPDKAQGYNPETIWKNPDGQLEGTEYTRITDSAAAATALNSGQKTKNSQLGIDFNGQPLKLYSEYAQEAGRSIGIVTTTNFVDATPAAVVAHQSSRGDFLAICQEQLNNQNVKVLFGAGHPEYKRGAVELETDPELDYKYVGGQETWEKIVKNDGYLNLTFFDDLASFEKLASETPDLVAQNKLELPERVLGVARTKSIIFAVDGASDEKGMEAVRQHCHPSLFGSVPTLSTMSIAALNVLSQNQNGFYLMIESALIDHTNHSRNIAGTVIEHTGFSKAIDAVCDWVEKYSSWDETLVIITADHETGQLWGPETYFDADENGKFSLKKEDVFKQFNPVVNNGQSVLPSVQYGGSGHSLGLVPLWAKGAGVDYVDSLIRLNDPKAGEFWNFSGNVIDNTDIFNLMLHASGFDNEGK